VASVKVKSEKLSNPSKRPSITIVSPSTLSTVQLAVVDPSVDVNVNRYGTFAVPLSGPSIVGGSGGCRCR